MIPGARIRSALPDAATYEKKKVRARPGISLTAGGRRATSCNGLHQSRGTFGASDTACNMHLFANSSLSPVASSHVAAGQWRSNLIVEFTLMTGHTATTDGASTTNNLATTPTNPRVLRLPQVLAVTGLGRSMIYQMEAEGRFPPRVRIGARAVGWVESEVQEWPRRRIEMRRVQATPPA